MGFGHLYLEGGTKNLNSKEYSLGDKNSKAARVGTLMRVCDYTEVEEDGRMILAVQALDRFRVIRSTPSSSGPLSYNSATVELLPDREDLGRLAWLDSMWMLPPAPLRTTLGVCRPQAALE